MTKRYTITSALPYANGPLHIGHVAGAYLPADIFVRFLRLKGEDVIFVCGSDEHGVPITIRAKQENRTPQQVVDEYHEVIARSFKGLKIDFDIFSRTSHQLHHETARDFFKKLYDKGSFIEIETEQYFDEEANQFLADRYIIGKCPKCGNEEAYGDQCESCGSSLSPTELINPKSTLSGAKPVLRKTRNYFLPLDKIQKEFLNDYIAQRKNWKVNVIGQCKSWLNEGLEPRAMTRDLDWGIPLPIPNSEGKVMYVWFDAPIGYISATKELMQQRGEDWEKWWKDEETELIHFIGKDNIVFHGLIFPAMLHEHGGFITPNNVPANEFLNLEGKKFSTSRNWAVWVHEFLQDFPEQEDVLRYVLSCILPETKDSEFTWKDFQTRNNSELVAILGNFVNRVLVLMDKYNDSKVPVQTACSDLQQYLQNQKQLIEQNMFQFRFRDALFEVMNIARYGNKFLADNEPWKLIKTDPEKTQTILYDAVQIVANLAIAVYPFMPGKSKKIAALLNLETSQLSWENFGKADLIAGGKQMNKAEILFDKIEDDTINKQLDKLNNLTASHNKIPKMKDSIQFDEFAKMDIRVGEILDAKKVEGADKLLQMTVDVGFEKRTIVSGIALHYKPEDVVGKKVQVLVNLQARKIRGVESKGMILLAETQEGKLVFMTPAASAENGSVVS